MEVHTLNALSDNFMYLIVDTATKLAACVDPADAEDLVAAATELGVKLAYVLTTHHHYDHAGGNKTMKKLVPGVEVICGKGEGAQGATRELADGDQLKLGDAVTIQAVHTPAHTNGHTSYLMRAAGVVPAAFTGDALFVGGCGRFFEGGPEDMCVTMQRLGLLPPETRVFAGHEYTLKNLQFALTVEPENVQAQRKILWAQEQRAQGLPTVPSTVSDERGFNPFMRVAEPTVRACGRGPIFAWGLLWTPFRAGGVSDRCGCTPGDSLWPIISLSSMASRSQVRAFCDDALDDVTCMRRLRNKKDNFAGSSRPWVPGGGPLPGL